MLDMDTAEADNLVEEHIDEFVLLNDPRILFHINACRWSHEFKTSGPRVVKGAMVRHLNEHHRE